MAEEKDNNKQPELDDRLTPSNDVKDWNPKAEEYQPTNQKLAASMQKAQEQVNDDPNIKKGLSQVQSQDMEQER